MIEQKKDRNLPAILGGEPAFEDAVYIIEPAKPTDKKAVLKVVSDIIDKSMYNLGFGYRKKFEESVEKYLQLSDKKAFAVNSGTDAIILLLLAAGIKEMGRDEVIIPSFTFHATVRAILRAGLKPVFADIDPESFNLDPVKTEELITKKTGAIMPVDVFGNPSQYCEFEKLSKKHGLYLLFDSAGALGASYKNIPIGNFGDGTIISFSFGKVVQAFGRGGVVILTEKFLENLLNDPRRDFMASRMQEINAVMAYDVMQSVEEYVNNRQKAGEHYEMLLKGLPGLTFQKITDGAVCSYTHFPVVVNETEFGLNRDQFKEALKKEGIITKEYFPAQHRAFKGFKCGSLINTEIISDNILCLPVWSNINNETVKKISQAIQKIFMNRNEIQKYLNQS